MNNYKFILEPYKTMKTVFYCPNCGKKTFTKYIDTEKNNEYLNDNVGRCNRVIKCNYHYKPRQYFRDNNFKIKSNYTPIINALSTKPKPPSLINSILVKKSFLMNSENKFIQFLEKKLFGKEITKEVIEKYKVGTSSFWKGATIFWQIDEQNNVRTGKIILYNETSGKRIKKPYNHVNWVHKTENIYNFNLEQCYFGLHLINQNKDLPIAIVESEKTAIISSIYLPEFIWLACGGVNNLTEKKTKVLQGRSVVLFPDLKCFDLWKEKIPKLSNKVNYIISDLLEKNATEEEKMKGYDLADYLINLNIDFNKYI